LLNPSLESAHPEHHTAENRRIETSVLHRCYSRCTSLSELICVDSRCQQALVSADDTMTRHAVPDLLPGTLDLLILRTLQTQSLHGWAISERIQQISQDVLQINQGSLYPALHRLEHQGWIEADWAVSELGRRAKYYRLTASGRRQLAVEASEWERMSTAIGRVMKLA
jgi:PadR family transcriptional regulator PadR